MKVWGRAYDSQAELGDLSNYAIRVDLVLFGDESDNTIEGDPLYTYIDARGGNDTVTGSEADEEIVGGAGDDDLSGGAGNDVLVDSQGANVLSGGAGNDIIDVSGTQTPNATIDGGEGTDTLRVTSDTNWSNLSITNVEVLDGQGGRTNLTPQDLLDRGFTTANNITFRVDPNSSGGTIDASGLLGNFTIRGSNQSDVLTGNDGNNTIYLQSDQDAGSGQGSDTVSAGAGADTIVWETSEYQQADRFFTSADNDTRTYFIEGALDGGEGSDELVLRFDQSYWYHSWGGNTWNQENSPAWTVDLTGLSIDSIERIRATGYRSDRFWAYPNEFVLTASQIEGLTSTSGLRAVAIKGGGTIDLDQLASIGISTWRIADDGAYTIVGTDSGDVVTLGQGQTTISTGAGSDTIKIDDKSLVTDIIDGGEGEDTLSLVSGNVDLSGATLSNIERILVSADSLAMSQSQWDLLGDIVVASSSASPAFTLSLDESGFYTLDADSRFQGLSGAAGNDNLTGNDSDNVLAGNDGDDTLSGGAGDDRLIGGVGVDVLLGGEGNDVLDARGELSVLDRLSGGDGVDTLLVEDQQDLTGAVISGIEEIKGSGTV